MNSVNLVRILVILAVVGAIRSGEAVGQGGLAPTDELQLSPLPAPGPIQNAEYAARRQALAAMMEDGIFVAFGSPDPELDYLPYAQEANFRYLTGILEPEAALILIKTGTRLDELLYVQERDPSREIWEGARLGVEGAQALTGMTVYTTDRLLPMLDSLVVRHPTLYVVASPPTNSDALLSRDQQIVAKVAGTGTRVTALADGIQRLRARKSPTELDFIRRAVQITVLAHR